MTLLKNHQAMFALFLIVLDVGYFAEALRLPRPFQLGEPGPSFMPLILAAVLLIAAGRILWMELAGSAPLKESEDVRITGRAIAMIFATGVFVWIFEPLGYWIATLLYVFTVALLFEQERLGLGGRVLATSAMISVGVTLAGWLFFVVLFDLFLPSGVF